MAAGLVVIYENSVVGGQRIDDLRNLRDFRDRDAAQFGVLVDRFFSLGQMNAEGFLTRHTRALPLDAWTDRGQGLITRVVSRDSAIGRHVSDFALQAKVHPQAVLGMVGFVQQERLETGLRRGCDAAAKASAPLRTDGLSDKLQAASCCDRNAAGTSEIHAKTSVSVDTLAPA